MSSHDQSNDNQTTVLTATGDRRSIVYAPIKSDPEAPAIERKLDYNASTLTGSLRQRLCAFVSRNHQPIIVGLLLALLLALVYLAIPPAHQEAAHSAPGARPFRGAVTTNGSPCARIGRQIFERNGSVADATIAAMLCESVACPQSLGLGGGFVATVYIRETREAFTLNSREVAPLAATANMYANKTQVKGTDAIAVPAALAGFWSLHQRYGRLPWADLFAGAIELCEQGAPVSSYLASVLRGFVKELAASPTLAPTFINAATGDVWLEGDRIRMPRLAETFRVLAREGLSGLYTANGTIYKRLRADLDRLGGDWLTEADFTGYRVRWTPASTAQLRTGPHTVYSSALPATGFLSAFVVRVMEGFGQLDENAARTYHWMTEAFKYAFAHRTELGDPDFVKGAQAIVDNITSDAYVNDVRQRILATERTVSDYRHYGAQYELLEDQGTAHINVLAPNGDAIAVTSTINDFFGTMLASESTGIILNDQMDDFSNPGIVNTDKLYAAPSNRIAPRKQPISSLSPTILVDAKGDVSLMIGGAGGTKITTSVACAIVRHLLFNATVEEIVLAPRLHHQLMPMKLYHEVAFNGTLLKELQERFGHQTSPEAPRGGFGSIGAIGRNADGQLAAHFDRRRGGGAELF